MTLNFRRTTLPTKTSIGVVIDHHSIDRDNGYFVDWDAWPVLEFGQDARSFDNGVGGKEKVIPNGCPAVIFTDTDNRRVLRPMPALDGDVTALDRGSVVAVIGPVFQFERNLAINGVGVMRRAGLYENLLHGATTQNLNGKTVTRLRAVVKTAMEAAGFYFAVYQDRR